MRVYASYKTTDLIPAVVALSVGLVVGTILSPRAGSSQPESITGPIAVRFALEPGTYFIVPLGKTLRVHREGACTLLLRYLEEDGPTKNVRVQEADFFADGGDYVALPQEDNQKKHCDLDATLYPAAATPLVRKMHGRNAP